MDGTPSPFKERRIPTRRQAALFRFKSLLLQARRSITNAVRADEKRHPKDERLTGKVTIARSITPLWTATDERERVLVAGKIQNLRVAVRRLHGVEIPAGRTFSFWKQVGRASPWRGFVAGRELREGCIIPNVGGGLCQLSNALYDAALQAGFEIIERHAHTQVVAGSLAETGRDATVFWNYVDLRFRSATPFRLEAHLDGENLTVRFRGEKRDVKTLHQIARTNNASEPNSCATCETGDCHRVIKPAAVLKFGRAAFLVDEFTPEFDDHIQEHRTLDDLLCIPIDGRRFRKANYAWNVDGFLDVRQSLIVTGKRAYSSRKLAAQGAARQLNLLATYEELAESYARRLSYDVLHLTVQQNLLPFLWKNGHLGGRTFDVLMTALPMHELQTRLDRAGSLRPESKTLGDFRADASLVETEREALKNAACIITPHSEIAALYPDNAHLLDWQMPTRKPRPERINAKPVVAFPAATVGRKGCYELRAALRAFDVKLITLGPMIEASDFWSGFDVERGANDWLERADVVILPAFVEHKPRRLLLAAASGVPVIASTACGLGGVEGITNIPAGDVDALADALGNVLK